MLFRLLLLRLRVRKAPAVSLWDQTETPFRVLPTDLDVLRHMNNGRYLTLLDLGRLDLMMRSGFGRIVSDHGWYSVVSAQTISYKRSLTLWQRFVVRTRVLGVDERSTYMEQEFVRGDTVVARAVIQARFLRKTGGTISGAEVLAVCPEPMPEDMVLPEWVTTWADEVRISSSAS
nr:acyl-CoA thioesterase [Microbacterium amylolyticum]